MIFIKNPASLPESGILLYSDAGNHFTDLRSGAVLTYDETILAGPLTNLG